MNRRKHSFRQELTPAQPDYDDGVFELYEEFQRDAFQDTDCTREGFMSFLGESSMEQSSSLGTFWWKWYVDDELIAVSVLDILPTCVVAMERVCSVVLGVLPVQEEDEAAVDWHFGGVGGDRALSIGTISMVGSEVAWEGELHARSVHRGVSAHALQGSVSWVQVVVSRVALFRSPGGGEGEVGAA